MTTNNILKAIHGAVKAGLAVCFGIVALFGGCKDTVSSSPCNCQEKDHATACACGGDNCTCTVKANPKIYPIEGHSFTVEDRTWEVTQHVLDLFKSCLDGDMPYYPNLSARNIKLIIVEENIASGIESGEDNKTIKANIDFLLTNYDADISMALNITMNALEIARINNSNNIRLVNAQPVITPRAQVAYERANRNPRPTSQIAYNNRRALVRAGAQGCLAPFCLTEGSAKVPDTIS
jgi:hypothetical protein